MVEAFFRCIINGIGNREPVLIGGAVLWTFTCLITTMNTGMQSYYFFHTILLSYVICILPPHYNLGLTGQFVVSVGVGSETV